ncbi:MAG: phytoene desaturase, partial [Pseudomonadota bacterium]
TPFDFRDRYRSPHGAGFSLEPRILQSAWFRPHNVSESVRGLYLVGAGTHPGAGLPGVVSSAEVLDQLVPEAAHAR